MIAFLKKNIRYFAFLIVIIGIIIWLGNPEETGPQYLFWKNRLPTSETIGSIVILDENNIWMSGSGRALFVSHDLAETWEQVPLPQVSKQPDTYIEKVRFITAEIGWVLLTNGELYYSADAGTNWERTGPDMDGLLIHDMHFINSHRGIIAGEIHESAGRETQGVLLRTTDGGDHWFSETFESSSLLQLFFYDDNNGIAVASHGLLQTTDSGTTWEVVNSLHLFTKLEFFNETNGCAFKDGENGQWYSTVDGGASWTEIESFRDRGVSDLYFFDPMLGWAVGSDGLVLHTSDGGNTWNQLETGVVEDMKDVNFVNREVGFIAGSNGIVLKIEVYR
ncbi:WD40/YVTN/BNR-like repeat-containing protein [candidate division KSB1 bacterium]